MNRPHRRRGSRPARSPRWCHPQDRVDGQTIVRRLALAEVIDQLLVDRPGAHVIAHFHQRQADVQPLAPREVYLPGQPLERCRSRLAQCGEAVQRDHLALARLGLVLEDGEEVSRQRGAAEAVGADGGRARAQREIIAGVRKERDTALRRLKHRGVERLAPLLDILVERLEQLGRHVAGQHLVEPIAIAPRQLLEHAKVAPALVVRHRDARWSAAAPLDTQAALELVEAGLGGDEARRDDSDRADQAVLELSDRASIKISCSPTRSSAAAGAPPGTRAWSPWPAGRARVTAH